MELDKINWYGSSGRELTTNTKNLHIVKICLSRYIYKGSKISFLGGEAITFYTMVLRHSTIREMSASDLFARYVVSFIGFSQSQNESRDSAASDVGRSPTRIARLR